MRKKHPKGYVDETRFGILNRYGDIWTSDTFKTEGAAREHLTNFWRNIRGVGDLAQFQVVPVRVHVTALPIPAALSQGEKP